MGEGAARAEKQYFEKVLFCAVELLQDLWKEAGEEEGGEEAEEGEAEAEVEVKSLSHYQNATAPVRVGQI